MTELEDRLRAMLHERAADIGDAVPTVPAVPAVPRAVPDVTTTQPGRTGRRRPRAWLLSAAALAVVAVGLGALLIGTDDSRPDGPQPGTASPTTAPALRAVALDRLDPTSVARYAVRATGAFAGYRDVSWHRTGDLGRTSKTNTGSAVSVQGVVLDAGRFPERLVSNTRPDESLRPDGAPAYLLNLPQFRSGRPEGPDAVPSIAWQFSTRRWAVVQQVTDVVTAPELRRLALALRPSVTVPVTVPFRLRTLPPGRLVEVSDNRPYYPQTLVYGDGTTTTRIQIHRKADRTQPREDWIAHYVSGLTGYLDPQNGGYVEYAGGILTISAEKDGGELDTALVKRIFAGLRWSGGDGSGPGVPLTEALGR